MFWPLSDRFITIFMRGSSSRVSLLKDTHKTQRQERLGRHVSKNIDSGVIDKQTEKLTTFVVTTY